MNKRRTPTLKSWQRLKGEYSAARLRRDSQLQNPEWMPVLARHRPLLPDAKIVRVAEGTPISAVVDLAYPQPEYRGMARVAIDGRELPAELWERQTRRGEIMVLTLVPGLPGLGLGSDTLRNVLTLAFTVGGAAITQFVGGVEGWVIGTALTLLGPMVLNLLIPPAQIQDVTQIGYSLRGSRNASTPWECIPKIYGRHKVYPPLGARPYSETIGDDLFVRALFIIGFGPLLIEALKIGDQPVLDGDGNAAFTDMEIEIRSGYADDAKISLVTQDVGEETVGQEIIYEADTPLLRTTEADTEEISLDIEFPDGLGNTVNSDTNGWSVNFRLMYRPFGFGDDAWLEVDEPLAEALNDIDTIQTLEGQLAYLSTILPGLTAEVATLAGIDVGDRIWTEDVSRTILDYIQIWLDALTAIDPQGNTSYADEIADFSAQLFNLQTISETFIIGVPGSAWVTILRSLDKIKVAVDVVSEISRINNYVVQGYGPSLSSFPFWAQLLIRWRGLAPLFSDPPPEAVRVTASKTGVVRRGFRWKVPKGKYDVMVIRVSAPVNTDDDQYKGVAETAFWSVLRSIHYQDPIAYARLPPLAMIAMRVKAGEQFNGVLDQVNLIATAILRVPTPDGMGGYTYPLATTRNPAHALIECLTGAQQPRPVTLDRLDMDAFYAWALACDAEDFTEDGGPTKEGRTFDAVISKDVPLDSMARTIATAGKADFRSTVPYSVVRDVVQTVPVAHFSPANSWGFRGEKNHAEQPHGLRVSFIDEAADWNQSERLVFNDGYTAENATKYETLSLTGITDARQVWADARYFLAVSKLRPRRFTWNTDLNWAIINRGMLVRVNHDVPLWGLAFGRIIETETDSGTTTLRLDNFVPLTAAGTYQLIAVYSDGYGHTVLLDAVAEDGHYTTITFTGTWPASPATATSAGGVAMSGGALFMLGTMGNVTQDLIVTDIAPTADKTAQITAVDAAPGVHRDPGDPIPPFDPNVDVPPVLQEPAPPAPVFRLFPAEHAHAGEPVILSDEQVLIVGQDGTLTPQIVAYLDPAIVPRGQMIPFRLQRQIRRLADANAGDGADTVNPWVGLPDMPATVLDVPFLPVVEAKRYDIRLRYVAQDGTASPWATITNYLVIGKTSPPPDVIALYLDIGNILRWNYPARPVDFSHFELRMLTSIFVDPGWESAIPIGTTDSTSFPVPGFATSTATILVKGIDSGGRESVNPAVLLLNITGATPANVLDITEYDPTWDSPDILAIGGEVQDGKVLAPFSEDDLFWTGADSDLFWDGSDSDLFWNFAWETLAVVWNWTPPAGTNNARLMVAYSAVHATEVAILYGVDLPPEAFSGDLLSYLAFFPGAAIVDESKVYTLAFLIIGRADSHGEPRPELVELATVADVEDIVEKFADLEIEGGSAAAGLRLPIARTYHKILGVGGLTLQDTGTGAVVLEVVDKGDPSPVNPTGGPLIKAKDGSGAYVGAVFDADVWGY